MKINPKGKGSDKRWMFIECIRSLPPLHVLFVTPHDLTTLEMNNSQSSVGEIYPSGLQSLAVAILNRTAPRRYSVLFSRGRRKMSLVVNMLAPHGTYRLKAIDNALPHSPVPFGYDPTSISTHLGLKKKEIPDSTHIFVKYWCVEAKFSLISDLSGLHGVPTSPLYRFSV